MAISNGETSGSNPLAASANWNLSWASGGMVLISDGFGNVASSYVPLSSLEGGTAERNQDCGTF